MLNDLAQSWLALQCQMIPGVRRAILLMGTVEDAGVVPAASWPTAAKDSPLLTESGRQALKKRAPVVRAGGSSNTDCNDRPVVIACPLFQRNQLFGVVALEVETLDENQQHNLLQLLKWGSAWLELLPRDHGAPQIAGHLTTVIEITAEALEHSSLHATASAVTTKLARTFNCDRVSLGLVDERRSRVEAISHSAQIDRRSDLVRDIEAAMDEALDEGRTLAHPSMSAADRHGLPAHEVLCRNHEHAAACTLVLVDAGKAIATLTLERLQGPPFDQATLDVCEAMAALLGPILQMKRLQDRPISAKAGDTLRTFLGRFIGPNHLRSKLLIGGILGLAVWLSLATGDYRVSATAVLEGTEQRALVAPIEGYVKEAHARAGERVKQDDLIATLDDRELEQQRRRWASERDDLAKRLGRAIGSLDRAEAAIIEAQLGKASAQLALVEEQLARTRIVAPIDGVIVSGDLSRALGSPVERGQVLFEIAPLDAYRMALQVSEGEIAHVRRGQHGHLALASMPGKQLPFVVEDIIGVAETEDGQNGFRVEARLEETAAQLRPGMRGVGKIEVEERSLLWIWTHTLLDRISLWLWSHLP